MIYTSNILRLRAALLDIGILPTQDVSPQCHKYAIPSLCFFAFPPCEPGNDKAEPRSVCRDECELLEHSLCRMEYSIAKRHPLIGQQNILPVCENLAPVGSPESEACLRLGVPHREAEDVNKGELSASLDRLRGLFTLQAHTSAYIKTEVGTQALFFKLEHPQNEVEII